MKVDGAVAAAKGVNCETGQAAEPQASGPEGRGEVRLWFVGIESAPDRVGP